MPVSKRIIVTGASRGLGRALVDGFVARGHVVFGCARSAKAIADLRRRYPAPNGFAVVDVSRRAKAGYPRDCRSDSVAGNPDCI